MDKTKKFETYFNGIISMVFLVTVFVSLGWQNAVIVLLFEALIAMGVNMFICKRRLVTNKIHK